MLPYILEQNEKRTDYNYNRKTTPVLDILRSKTTKGVIVVSIFAFVVPVLVYYFIIHKSVSEEIDNHTCAIKNDYKIPCGKSEQITFEYCSSISCCFDNVTQLCFHYLPSKYYYFQEQNVYKPSLEKSPFGIKSEPNISLSINEVDENLVQIILHKSTVNVPRNRLERKKYSYVVSNNPLYAEVYRNSSANLLLTTAKGPTIVSENYWEWSFQLSEDYLFGLGELLIEVDENSTFTKVIYPNSQDHNTLPIFMANIDDKFHGLIVRHEGPLEVTVLPSKLVILKSLVESQLILEVSIGEKPSDVRKQLKSVASETINLRTLGVHICREGNTLSLEQMLEEYQDSIKSFTFQYESDCIHDNLVLALLDESSPNTTILQNILQNMETNFMLSLPPQMLNNSEFYLNTIDQVSNIYYKNGSKIYVGKYQNKNVTYPDFELESSSVYMQLLIEKLISHLGDQIFLNNLILIQNWPSDESFEMKKIEHFQYLSEAILQAMSSTLPWNVTSSTNQLHFTQHNNYGALHLNKVLEQLTNLELKEPFIMTAANNFGISRPLLIQNIDISWSSFKSTIISTLYNSVFNHPLVSIPVCGSTTNFNKTVHESLCLRWYLMASTSPLFRISSDLPRRDPTLLNTLTARNIAKRAIDIRYQLQYYYHAILNSNEPLTRPMFYNFPEDKQTFALNEQYMVGDSILVAHPTLPDKTSISIYLPEGVEVWYEIWGGTPYNLNSRTNGWINFGVVESDWIGFIPQGKIIPLVEGDISAYKKLVTLIAALECIDNICTASGTMSSDFNLFTFNVKDSNLTIEKTSHGVQNFDFELNRVLIYNHQDNQENVTTVNCIALSLDSINISLDDEFACPTTTTSTSNTEESTTASETLTQKF